MFYILILEKKVEIKRWFMNFLEGGGGGGGYVDLEIWIIGFWM